jgi:hypothetical protein
MHYYTPIPDLSVQLRCLIYLEGYLKKSNLTHKYFTPTMRSMLRLGTQTQAFSTANAVAHIFSYGWDSPEVPKSTRLYVGAKRVLFGLADARAPYYQDRIDKAFHEIQGARREGSGFWKKDLSPLANFFDYCIERARGFGQSLEDYEAYLMQAAQKWSLEHEQPALFKQVKAASPSQDSIATSLADKATTKVLYAMNYAEQIQLQQASPDLIGPLKSLHLDLKKESIATPPPKCRA